MGTQTATTAIANQIHSTDSAIQTYKVHTTGMSPELLTLVQNAVATTKLDKKGKPYKSFDSEGNFIFVTGFHFANQVMLSAGTNKQGLPCLNYDDILTAEDKRAIVQARRFNNSPVAPVAQTPIIVADPNNVNL
jgi:hypothetical protein